MDYEDYDQKCNEIRVKNEEYLAKFREDLTQAGLTQKTIVRHFSNIDFYINTYLLREEPLEMDEGSCEYKLDNFFGYFFIRKCMWSTPASIKSTAASVKKFYKSMLEHGHISNEQYDGLISTIRSNMQDWIHDCEAYNDPDAPNPFDFFA